METKTLLDFIPICISVIALLCSAVCMLINRINVSAEYRSKIMTWYGQCVSVIMKLKRCSFDEKEKNLLLGELSGLIEYGRFFFPNIDKGDGFGKNKPAAYQGYRSHVLEYLVLYYDMFNNNTNLSVDKSDDLQRRFTSAVYAYLKPWKFIRRLDLVLQESYKKDFPIEDDGDFVL